MFCACRCNGCRRSPARLPPRRRVQQLFHSVQLNVNNPHFLIMQGRITKARGAVPCCGCRLGLESRLACAVRNLPARR